MSDVLVPLRVRKTGPAPSGPRLYIETYGCQMNVADSDLIAALLGRGGFVRTEHADEAEVIVVNTCAVRERAAERVLARAAELQAHKRRRPGVVLAITGCVAEHLKEGILERAPHVDVIAGPDSYRRLPDLIESARAAGRRHDPLVDVRLDREETYAGLGAANGGDGVSCFLTIQRGCDKFCTFCVVPFTRGRERGTPPDEVLRQARALAAAGYREVTLLGQTVSSYRHGDVDFAALLRAVARVDGIERVRFTSPYPLDFTDGLIAAIAEEPRVCKHVHLPLQCGSDPVLERMRRGYTAAEFRRTVAALRAAAPSIAVTTDILVGFSGETEDDHRRTVALMEELRFDTAFLFAYSERDGTLAARQLPDDVPAEEKGRRLAEVIHLQERISSEINAALVGRVERVLIGGASKRSDDQLMGRTDGFKAVIVPRDGLAPGDLVDVRIERSTPATLFGLPAGG